MLSSNIEPIPLIVIGALLTTIGAFIGVLLNLRSSQKIAKDQLKMNHQNNVRNVAVKLLVSSRYFLDNHTVLSRGMSWNNSKQELSEFFTDFYSRESGASLIEDTRALRTSLVEILLLVKEPSLVQLLEKAQQELDLFPNKVSEPIIMAVGNPIISKKEKEAILLAGDTHILAMEETYTKIFYLFKCYLQNDSL